MMVLKKSIVISPKSGIEISKIESIFDNFEKV